MAGDAAISDDEILKLYRFVKLGKMLARKIRQRRLFDRLSQLCARNDGHSVKVMCDRAIRLPAGGADPWLEELVTLIGLPTDTTARSQLCQPDTRG